MFQFVKVNILWPRFVRELSIFSYSLGKEWTFLWVFTVCVVLVVFISSVFGFLFLCAKYKRQFSVSFLSCSCSRVDHVCVFLFS